METRIFSALRVIISFRAKARALGASAKKRMQMRAISGVTSLANCARQIAYNKSSTVLGDFLACFHRTMYIRKTSMEFLKGIKRLQKKWKGTIKLNNTRKLILRSKWDKALSLLIKQYQSKGKKHLPLTRKLMGMTENTITKVLNIYYNAQKKKYYTQLAKWIEIKQTLKSDQNPVERQSSKMLVSSTTKLLSKKLPPYPYFQYIPSSTAITNMILQTVNAS